MIIEDYLRKSHRRLKDRPHGQIVELYAARQRTSSLARARGVFLEAL